MSASQARPYGFQTRVLGSVPGMRCRIALCVAAVALGIAPSADASRFVRFGVQDDAWLVSGPGTLDSRLDLLDRLGVDLVRYTIRWDEVAVSQDEYDWSTPDAVLAGLRERGIGAVATILGSPSWANGGRAANWVPLSGRSIAAFASASAQRYRWVRDWLVWNEPNQRRWLRPTSPAVYVARILNPAYAAIKRANPRARVGGGVTAPRGGTGGVSPVAWIRGMSKARARLDAYAHHPYPLDPRRQTPWRGGCVHCSTITISTLERLISEVRQGFGSKRIWLTEFAYQTNPPERWLGVSWPLQARYLAEASHRAYAAPYVDMLIHYIVRDDRNLGGWQSGLFTAAGRAKPSYDAFRFPLAQVRRRGTTVVLWGQIRPRSGSQPFRLRVRRGGRWHWLGGVRRTDGRGVFVVTVQAPRGATVQIWSLRDRARGLALRMS